MAIFHPFYISLTEARYNETNRNFEIAQKLFWDDLETVLSEEYDKKVNFLRPVDQKELDNMLENYLLKHNTFYVNGKEVELKYMGYEVEEEAAWFYFQSGKVPTPKEVGMKNSVFLKQFETQQHVVNLYVDKKPKTLMLDRRKDSGKANFK
jgi:hypothetical protein